MIEMAEFEAERMMIKEALSRLDTAISELVLARQMIGYAVADTTSFTPGLSEHQSLGLNLE